MEVTQFDDMAVDSALVLENRLKERVEKLVEKVVINIVGREIHAALEREKQALMMEIAVTIGKTMLHSDNESRRPLWESKPEEFGFDSKDLNTHNLSNNPPLELDNALQEPSRP
jgi:hypothetical protein